MILIVGGAGYIGSHVNKFVTIKGYDTIVLDNLSKGHREFVKWGEFIQGDLGNTKLLERIFEEYGVDTVMHFAAFTDVGESMKDPHLYYNNNVKNTLNLLNAMIDAGVPNFVFSSTAAVYGNPLELPIDEEHPLDPINPYGRSKLMVERILMDYSDSYDFNYVSLRYFNAGGADPDGEIGEWHEPETHFIPKVLEVAAGKRSHVDIYGTDYPTRDGTCIRDYIHVMDIADAHWRALEYLENGESNVFNLGNGDGFSVLEIIETCMEVTGKTIKVREGERRPGDPPKLISDSKKAYKFLGWKPKFDELRDIIETAWDWQKNMYKNSR